MTDQELLGALKVDLGISTTAAYDARLAEYIASAKESVKTEGAATLDTAGRIDDAQLVIMYAAWTWRRRDTMEGMPRMLRWALNNRIMAEKAGA